MRERKKVFSERIEEYVVHDLCIDVNNTNERDTNIQMRTNDTNLTAILVFDLYYSFHLCHSYIRIVCETLRVRQSGLK